MIKNIIFDQGKVILELDVEKTISIFKSFGIEFPHNFLYTIENPVMEKLFYGLEVGDYTELEFYDHFRDTFQTSLSDEKIKNAWDAMLLNFTPEKIETLYQLKEKYKIILFSNTNIIHEYQFKNKFKSQFNKDISDLFHALYFSHVIRLRKPTTEAFRHILQEQSLLPEETLFVDDAIANIKTAKAMGLHVCHYQPSTHLQQVVDYINSING